MARAAGTQSREPQGSSAKKRALTSPLAGSKKSPKSVQKRPREARRSGAAAASAPAQPCTKASRSSPTAVAAGAAPALEDLQTIVISLDRRQDRMEGCARRLDAVCPHLPRSRFSATDGKQTVIRTEEVAESWNTARNVEYQKMRAVRKGWNDLDTYQVRTLALSPGERGCAMSHIRAWRHCLELAGGGNRPLLVLEDDAAPTADFADTLPRALRALPGDAHVLYLGYSQAADWKREVSPELVESEYVWTTVAYVIWPAGARILLDQLPVNEPVDNWMAAACASGSIKSYCVRPKIVHQADAWNVNSDVAHSDEHYWGPCSDILHSDALYWGPDDLRGEADRQLVPSTSLWDASSEDSDESPEGP